MPFSMQLTTSSCAVLEHRAEVLEHRDLHCTYSFAAGRLQKGRRRGRTTPLTSPKYGSEIQSLDCKLSDRIFSEWQIWIQSCLAGNEDRKISSAGKECFLFSSS